MYCAVFASLFEAAIYEIDVEADSNEIENKVIQKK